MALATKFIRTSVIQMSLLPIFALTADVSAKDNMGFKDLCLVC